MNWTTIGLISLGAVAFAIIFTIIVVLVKKRNRLASSKGAEVIMKAKNSYESQNSINYYDEENEIVEKVPE
jgi:hypothetical protein